MRKPADLVQRTLDILILKKTGLRTAERLGHQAAPEQIYRDVLGGSDGSLLSCAAQARASRLDANLGEIE